MHCIILLEKIALEMAIVIVMDFQRSVYELNGSDFGESAAPVAQMHKQNAGSCLWCLLQ